MKAPKALDCSNGPRTPREHRRRAREGRLLSNRDVSVRERLASGRECEFSGVTHLGFPTSDSQEHDMIASRQSPCYRTHGTLRLHATTPRMMTGSKGDKKARRSIPLSFFHPGKLTGLLTLQRTSSWRLMTCVRQLPTPGADRERQTTPASADGGCRARSRLCSDVVRNTPHRRSTVK